MLNSAQSVELYNEGRIWVWKSLC